MMNYFVEALNVLESRAKLRRTADELERRQERLLRTGRPPDLRAASLEHSVSGTYQAADALADCVELLEITRKLKNARAIIQEIDEVIQQLEPLHAELLTAWYIRLETKNRIAEQMHYQTAASVYGYHKKAVARFAVLYFGAGAIAST